MASAESDAILDRLLTLHPKIIDLTLGRVERLLAAMGHPERELPPVVHVAGTNGKGSTIAMLREGLEAAGDRVHAYTSPHLVRFHERIRLAGELISEPALAALLGECEAANGAEPITFFEITTVAAMVAFARTPADWLLVEVGLGGRLDATNVVDRPALTIITPVSLDHQQYLGETLGEIAGEKAGILKPDVPCVVGPQAPEALEVIRARAAEVGAPLIEAGRDWRIHVLEDGLVFEDHNGAEDLPFPTLPGAHQHENAGIAVAALRRLGRDASVPMALFAEWPARMQRLTRGPLADQLPEGSELWLDGGHNPAAGAALAEHLAVLGSDDKPVWLVVGMLDTKAAEDYLRPLAPHVTEALTVAIPGADASLTAEELARRAKNTGLSARPASSVEQALGAIASAPSMGAAPRIVICGSLYLAGHVLRENGG